MFSFLSLKTNGNYLSIKPRVIRVTVIQSTYQHLTLNINIVHVL